MKKLVISESQARYAMMAGILNEDTAVRDIINSKEFEKKVKSICKDICKTDKGYEQEVRKAVKKAIIDTLGETFRALWQRKSSWAPMV